MVTIVEGEARVIRGGAIYRLAPGLRLQADDLIQTSGADALLRLEHPGWSAALDLGPQGRAWLGPTLPGSAWYVAQGWFKATSTGTKVMQVSTPMLDLKIASATAMTQIDGSDRIALFAETGSPGWNARSTSVRLPGAALKQGDFAQLRTDGKPVQVQPRPPSDWLGTMPRALRDTLPMLFNRYPEAPAWPAPVSTTLRYDDLAPWLQGEPAVRRAAVQRWRHLAERPDFRAELIRHLSRHPEWRPILYPPPPPSAARPTGSHPAGSSAGY